MAQPHQPGSLTQVAGNGSMPMAAMNLSGLGRALKAMALAGLRESMKNSLIPGPRQRLADERFPARPLPRSAPAPACSAPAAVRPVPTLLPCAAQSPSGHRAPGSARRCRKAQGRCARQGGASVRVIKRRFGQARVRHRGLKKNTMHHAVCAVPPVDGARQTEGIRGMSASDNRASVLQMAKKDSVGDGIEEISRDCA